MKAGLVQKANDTNISLFDALIENSDIKQHLGEYKLRYLTTSKNYLGLAQEIVRRVLDE